MPSYQLQAGFAGGAKGWDYCFFVFKNVVTEEIAYYDFVGRDTSYSFKLPVSVGLWSDWSEIFSAPCGIKEFGVKVAFNSFSAVIVSFKSYLVFLEGPAKGIPVNTSGWQFATPGASLTGGKLIFSRYVPPLTKGWPDGHFLVGVWCKYGIGATSADGSIPKFWGTLTLSNRRSDFNQFSWQSARLTWPWMWTPEQKPRQREAPDACDGKWDLPSAKTASLYNAGGQAFAELYGFEDSLSGPSFVGGNSVSVIQQKIRQGEQPNGWMGAYQIYWIVSNRE